MVKVWGGFVEGSTFKSQWGQKNLQIKKKKKKTKNTAGPGIAVNCN